MAAGLGGAEEHFAKKLAHNDKRIRDRAVKRLQTWIASRPSTAPGFSEIELLKIWKGLFYCFWMSDKPLIQEELAVNISKLLHSFKNIDSGFTFIITFFKTFHKEWHGIDRLRLDKFYMLIRFSIRENFELLNKNSWKSSLCKRLATIYQEGPLSSTLENVPVGMKLHLCSIFLSELQSIKCKKVPSEAVTNLLEPFFNLAAQTKSQVVSKALKDGVFEKIWEIESRQAGEEGNDDADKENEAEDKTPLMVDFQEITEKLFNLASSRDILSRNRNMLYLYIKKFKKSTPEPPQNDDDVTKKRKAEDQEENKEVTSKKKKKKHTKSTKSSENDNQKDEQNNNEVSYINGTGEQETIMEEKTNKNKKKTKKTKSAEIENQPDEQNNNKETQLNGTEEQEATLEQQNFTTKKRKKQKKSGENKDKQDEEIGEETPHLNGTKGEEVLNAKKRKKQKKTKTGEAGDDHNNETVIVNAIEEDKAAMNEEEKCTEDEVVKTKKNKKQKKTKTGEAENNHNNETALVNGIEEEKAAMNEEMKCSEDEVVKMKKNKKQKKTKTAEDEVQNVEETSLDMSHLNGTEERSRKKKKRGNFDENQNEEDNSKSSSKKKQPKESDSSQSIDLNGIEQTGDKSEQSSKNHDSKQSSKNGIAVEELDKALKEMRQKISDTNSAAQTPSKGKNKKKRNESNLTPHAFATFTKTKTPQAYVKRPMPQTEPKKTKVLQLSTPKSAPSKRKKVTIELSKNIAQTPLDYVKSLKTSPSIPFDASRSPAFGLLKAKSPHSTPKSKKLTPMKRAKAVDFF